MITVETRDNDLHIKPKEVEMHKAKLLAIHCIDHRFQKMVDEDLRERANYGEFDRLSFPGTSKNFEIVKNAALLSLRLHDPDEVAIYEHEDCRGYGQDNSTETHKNNAQRLAEALKQEKPNLQVTTLIATFDGIKDL